MSIPIGLLTFAEPAEMLTALVEAVRLKLAPVWASEIVDSRQATKAAVSSESQVGLEKVSTFLCCEDEAMAFGFSLFSWRAEAALSLLCSVYRLMERGDEGVSMFSNVTRKTIVMKCVTLPSTFVLSAG